MEYIFSYGPLTYQMVTQMVILGFAVMLTAYGYLILKGRKAVPRYRLATVRAD
jgi:hypothetical protein